VANKPVLFYGLEAIAAAGITEVGIVVGDTAAEIHQAVGEEDIHQQLASNAAVDQFHCRSLLISIAR